MLTDVNGKPLKVGDKVRLLRDFTEYETTAQKDSIHIITSIKDGIGEWEPSIFYTKDWSLGCSGKHVELVEENDICSCDIMKLMAVGCKCGAIEKEREKKNAGCTE